MAEQGDIDAIVKRAEKAGQRSKIGKVRGLIDDIEKAKLAGASLKAIYEGMKEIHNFDFEFDYFQLLLHRVRKEQSDGRRKAAIEVAATVIANHPLRRSTDKQLPVGAGPEAGTPAANPAGGELPPSPQSPSDAVKPAKPPAPKKARGGNTRQESLSAEDLKKLSRGSPDLSAFEDDTD